MVAPAAFALAAAGIQIGTAFLLCPEAATPPLYREALCGARDDATVLTNVFTGRPARALVNRLARELSCNLNTLPEFPLPLGELVPLRDRAEREGSTDFTPLWSGQAVPLASKFPAGELTIKLAKEGIERLRSLDGHRSTSPL